MRGKLKLPTPAVAVVFAVALSGCGIGGGDVQRAVDEPLVMHDVGSVVPSSKSTNAVTTDGLSIQVKFRPGGYIDYRVANGDDWFLDLDDPGTRTFANRTGRLPATGTTLIGVLATKGAGRHVDDAAVTIDNGIALAMYTTVEDKADRDYLVWGTWVDAPENVTTPRDVARGAFSTGSDPYRQQDLAALTGIARYQGDVTGVYFEPAHQPVGGYSFEARATLEVDFGDARRLGTIRGTVDNFRFQTSSDGTRQLRSGTKVSLEPAGIGGANSGYFEATATGGFLDGTPLSGRWGGRFFGNVEADGKPGSLSGTLRSASDDRGFIGAFGAHSTQ